jgi:hypothetical protein
MSSRLEDKGVLLFRQEGARRHAEGLPLNPMREPDHSRRPSAESATPSNTAACFPLVGWVLRTFGRSGGLGLSLKSSAPPMAVAQPRDLTVSPRANGCCGFGEGTFAITSRNAQDAPEAAISTRWNPRNSGPLPAAAAVSILRGVNDPDRYRRAATTLLIGTASRTAATRRCFGLISTNIRTANSLLLPR